MNISQDLINNMQSNIISKTKKIYDKFLANKLNETLEEFIDATVIETINSLEEVDIIDAYILQPVIIRRQRTKQRWAKALNNNNSALKEELNLAKLVFENVANKDTNKFKNLYDVNTPKELELKMLEEINNWVKQDEKFVIDFRYLNTIKRVSSIKSALKNDIIYFSLTFLSQNSKNNNLITIPDTYMNIPIDSSKRNKLKLTGTTIIENEQYLTNDYYIDDDNIFRTLVGIKNVEREALAQTIYKTFNIFDHKIFTYVMSKRDSNFLTTRIITVDIGDIVKELFESDNSKNYDAVINSLLKISKIQCVILTKSKNGSKFSLFDNVKISDSVENRKRKIATIWVNECIISDFVSQRTISYYKDKFTNLSDISNVLAIHLQKIRLSKYEIKNDDIKVVLTYADFRAFISLGKRKKSNFVLISDKLAEIKMHNIIIKDFVQKGDKFHITFYPLSPIERKDLLKTIPIVEDIKELG